MNFQNAFDEAFVAVKGYIDRSLNSFETRIREIEDRQLVLETRLGASEKSSKPRIRVPAGREDIEN